MNHWTRHRHADQSRRAVRKCPVWGGHSVLRHDWASGFCCVALRIRIIMSALNTTIMVPR